MSERPELTPGLDGQTFCSHYWLKEELVRFLKAQGLPASGGKEELTRRIAHWLDTGEVLPPAAVRQTAAPVGELTLDTFIEENIVCSEVHRAFFTGHIGKSFTFNVAFQKWLKSNAGKTYADAVAAYGQILARKKTEKTQIGRQFEYNTYIRDFFADNPGRGLEEAIACWKYKKSLPGAHRYEQADLAALGEKTD